MTELERIDSNNNGQKPIGPYEVAQVTGLKNPKEALADYKQFVKAVLEHPELAADNIKWNDLLPENLISIVNAFTDEDYKKDDTVTSIEILVDSLQDPRLKEWTWYSSKLLEDGFEVYVEGVFKWRHTDPIRFLGIEAKNVKIIMQRGDECIIKLRNDVIQYKGLAKY